MPNETLIAEIENVFAEIVDLGGQNEDSKIVPNLTVVNAAPTNLDGWLIVSDNRDGDNILARKVGSVVYSNNDLVNVIFPKGGEAIAFQQGSESTNSGIWEIVPSTSTDIFYNKGQVGIGTATPGEALDVAGNITLDADIIHRGDTDTKISFTADDIEFTAGGLSMLKLTETAQDLVEIGDTGGAGDVDINFNNGQMFLEGSTGNFGIGTTVGTDNFTVQGASGVQTTAAFYTGDGDGTDNNSFVVYLVGTPGSIANRERLLLQGLAGNQFRFRSDAAGTGTLRPLVFETGSNTSQVYLNTNGRVGINANSPDAKFHSRQSSAAGAIAALALTQSDVDEPFTKYIGTAAAATLTRSIVAEADVTTATRQGFIKIEIEDLGNQVTDQDYYVPFFTLA